MQNKSLPLQKWLKYLNDGENPLPSLSKSFSFLCRNAREYENGEITPNDLPNFDVSESETILQCVRFGLMWQTGPYYIVYGRDGVHSSHTSESGAARVANESTVRWYREVEVKDRKKVARKAAEDAKRQGLEDVAENLDWLLEHEEMAINENLTGEDLPYGSLRLRRLVVLSIIFGDKWRKLLMPQPYLVSTRGEVTGVYLLESNAEKNATKYSSVVQIDYSEGRNLSPLSKLKSFVG